MAKTKGGPKTIYETINGLVVHCGFLKPFAFPASPAPSMAYLHLQVPWSPRRGSSVPSCDKKVVIYEGPWEPQASKMSKEPGGFLISKASKHMWLLTVWNHALFGEHRSLGCSPAMKVHSPNRSEVVWNSSPHLDMFCPSTKRCLKAYDPYGL